MHCSNTPRANCRRRPSKKPSAVITLPRGTPFRSGVTHSISSMPANRCASRLWSSTVMIQIPDKYISRSTATCIKYAPPVRHFKHCENKLTTAPPERPFLNSKIGDWPTFCYFSIGLRLVAIFMAVDKDAGCATPRCSAARPPSN